MKKIGWTGSPMVWSSRWGILLTLLLWLAGCDTDLVYVHVDNLPGAEADAIERLDLLLYINGQRYKRIEPITDPGAMRHIVLRLPEHTVGPIELRVDGQDAQEQVIARGNAGASLPAERILPTTLRVALMPVPSPLVRLIVELQGPLGEIELTDVPCERRDAVEALCYLSPATSVRARAKPRQDAYADWGGACEVGEPECELRADRSRSFRLLPRICSDQGWCWYNGLPQGNSLWGVWGSAPSDVWAVGEAGTILHYDGDHWAWQPPFTTKNLYNVWGLHRNDIWAAGHDRALYHYDGATWQPVELVSDGSPPGPDSHWIWGTWGDRSDSVWFGTRYGIYHWDGQTVTRSADVPEETGIQTIWGTAHDNIWAGGQGPSLYHRNGEHWLPAKLPAELPGGSWLTSMWGTDPEHVWMTTNSGELLFFDGTQFTLHPPSSKDAALGKRPLWGSSAADVWALGSPMARHWNGTSWSEREAGPLLLQTGIWGSGRAPAWGVGGSGLLALYEGSEWQSKSKNDTARSRRSWGLSATDVWAVGDQGLVKHWDGLSWRRIDAGTRADLTGIWGSSTNDIWIVGQGGTVRHFDGASWKAQPLPELLESDKLSDVWGSSADNVFISNASTGRVWIWHWDGTQWSSQKAVAPYALYSLFGTDADNIWAVGELGAVARWEPAAKQWRTTQIAGPEGKLPSLIDIWGSSATDLWAAGSPDNSYAGAIVFHWDGSGWSHELLPDTLKIEGIFGLDRDHVWLTGPRLLRREAGVWKEVTTPSSRKIQHVWGTSTEDLWAFDESGQVLRYRTPSQPSGPALPTRP